tara:strand:+ start:451 stop:624 length:174 start_codon:yes stop_codon:yes gene_type:complete
MEAIVKIKNIYGTDKVYPVNGVAMNLAEMAGNKTLTPESISIAKRLGFVFIVEGATI